MSTIDLQADLETRWRPSEAQITGADALFAARLGDPDVYSVHLLVHKHFGSWTAKVELVHLDGLFLTREAALDFLAAAAAEHHRRTGHPLTGGYTIHFGKGEWAVFEDIMTRLPDRKS